MKRNVESKEGRKFAHFLIQREWFVRKLHGNMFQAGLPDYILGRPSDGKLIFVELKVLRARKKYRPIDVFKALHGPQIGVILMLASKRCPVFILAHGPYGWLLATPPFNQPEYLEPKTLEKIGDELEEKPAT